METLRAQEASSSSTSRCSYDVFLSFRGADTRKTFTDHLHTALKQAGFHTFRDDEGLKRGEHVKSGLNRAIQQSKLSLIVLSKGYPFSEWCLDELLMILECKKISGHLIVPVFYDVELSDVRHQTGSIKEAFDRYDEKLKEEESKTEWMERVNGWRAALKEVADLSGMVLKNQADGHESKFIQEIIKEVNAKVDRSALKLPQFLVELNQTKSINLWLNEGSADVDMLVIWGMGGMGKTTIAKFVYNLNHHIFERSCFLANINRENCNQSNGLLKLQRQLLSKILRGQKEKIYNVDEGTPKIEDAIRRNRVFIVLDDVDNVKQLDTLIGTRDFYPGSKIIITTRNKWLLKARKSHKLHEVKMLDDGESLKLFSWHAFEKEQPLEGYTDQSIKVVQQCGGLPLALEVLGRSLAGKGLNEWNSALQKLVATQNDDIQDVLKISFDLLQYDDDKNLFLHIACFFVGEDKSYIVSLLDKCRYSTEFGMQNLVERSLLSTDNGKLEMHQLIQEMGREIVHQESPKDPGKRTRLWHHEDSFRVMKGNEGTESIEGLVLDMQLFKDVSSVKPSFDVSFPKKHKYEEFLNISVQFNKVASLVQPYFSFLSRQSEHTALRGSSGVELSIKAFERLKGLRLLQLKYVQFTGSYEHFPTNLAWLSWHGFPEKYMPKDLTLSKLVVLDMRYSMLEQVWERNMVLPFLQILDLSHSQRLEKVHNFLGLQNLERLILKGCVSLVDICDSICILERILVLDLEDCKKLQKLPRNLGSLERLIISGCLINLAEFKDEGTIMNTSLTSSKFNFNFWSWLFKPKRSSIINLSLPGSLVYLSLENCNLSEDFFPKDLSQLSLLWELNVSYNPIKSLPESIKSLTNLKLLDVTSCHNLRSIIGLPSSVHCLLGHSARSLKRITFESKPRVFTALLTNSAISEVQGFFKLEPIGAVCSDLINDLGLINVESLTDLVVMVYGYLAGYSFCQKGIQGLHEFGIFSTYIPVDEVPSWFSDENRRFSSSFTVPLPPDNYRIRGLNVCAVYGHANCPLDVVYLVVTKIHNETKNLTWIYHPRYFGFPKNRNENLAWLSHWKFGNQLEVGDVVTVTVVMSMQFQVKEIGINLVYGEMEDNVPENIDDKENDEVIGGDLTNFLLSTGAYFLSHSFGLMALRDLLQRLGVLLQRFEDSLQRQAIDLIQRVFRDTDLIQKVFGENITIFFSFSIEGVTDLIQRVFGENITIEEFRDWTWRGRNILCEKNYSLDWITQQGLWNTRFFEIWDAR